MKRRGIKSSKSALIDDLILCPKCGFDAFFWPRTNEYYCSACGKKTKIKNEK